MGSSPVWRLFFWEKLLLCVYDLRNFFGGANACADFS
jgi:hypothetical protein